MKIELYTTAGGKCPVLDYLKELKKSGNEKELREMLNFRNRLERYGTAVNETYPESVRKLNDDIYELRPGKHRIFFFFFVNDTAVLLHAYRKHSQKAPPAEIQKAEQERKDYLRREKP